MKPNKNMDITRISQHEHPLFFFFFHHTHFVYIFSFLHSINATTLSVSLFPFSFPLLSPVSFSFSSLFPLPHQELFPCYSLFSLFLFPILFPAFFSFPFPPLSLTYALIPAFATLIPSFSLRLFKISFHSLFPPHEPYSSPFFPSLPP